MKKGRNAEKSAQLYDVERICSKILKMYEETIGVRQNMALLEGSD